MDASTSPSPGLSPIASAKYSEKRAWWSFRLSTFKYLVPEGSFHPYVPAYREYSRFGEDLAPQIQNVIDCFSLSHQDRGSLFRPLLSREISGHRAVIPVTVLKKYPSAADIWLHQPHHLSHTDRGARTLRDQYRLFGLKRQQLDTLAFEPRITIIPRFPIADGTDWSPNAYRLCGRPPLSALASNVASSNRASKAKIKYYNSRLPALLEEAELLDVWAQACSLRAQMALYSPHLAHLTWDVGLFRPHVDDVRSGFASHCLAARMHQLPVPQIGYAQHCQWGAMLLLRPIMTLIHMQLVVTMQGYMFPLRTVETENSIVRQMQASLPAMRSRLQYVVDTILRFVTCTVSHEGIRILTERPIDYDRDVADHPTLSAEDYIVLDHPLGVEITLPVGASIPAEMLHEEHPNHFRRFYVPSAFRATGGTGTAWIAAAIEQEFADRGFVTVFRTFHYDSSSFKARLFFMDATIDCTPAYDDLKIWLNPFYQPYYLRRYRDQNLVKSRGLHFPDRVLHPSFWPTLFPLKDQPISRLRSHRIQQALHLGDPEDIVAASDATYFPGGVGIVMID